MSKTKEAMMEFTSGFYHTDIVWPGCGWRKSRMLKVRCERFSLSNGKVEPCEGKDLEDCKYCVKRK